MPGSTVNDANHSITMTVTGEGDPTADDSSDLSDWEINGRQNRLRVRTVEDDFTMEFIYTKQ